MIGAVGRGLPRPEARTWPGPFNLEVVGLTKRYRGPDGSEVVALAPLDLRLPPGSKVAVAGPSGSGKSTLLHLLAGLLRPSAGAVFWGGRELTAVREAEYARFRAESVGYVQQAFNLLPGFSALENVVLALTFAYRHSAPRERRAIASAMLRQLGLHEREQHRPDQLSQGQQQRVAVARALAHRPALVLADEPTASVDRETAELVTEALFGAVDGWQATLVVATHDPELLTRFERVVSLRRGQAVQLKRAPVSAFEIAWRSVRHRAVLSLLTALVLAVGLAVSLAVVLLGEALQRGVVKTAEPFDLIVGAKGSANQLVLSTIYLQDAPLGNLPYSVQEVLRADRGSAARCRWPSATWSPASRWSAARPGCSSSARDRAESPSFT
jgi:ABC-type lipoprotein export system ATPase subunit